MAKTIRKRPKPLPQVIEAFANEMEAAGEHPSTGSEDNLKEWLQKHSERELWFFSRWILGNDFLGLGTFHRKIVCPYLTDFSTSRFKLLMLPMGHLKTTVVSRSLPLHAMIQPKAQNIYLPGKLGSNMRVLLANENKDKCKENLGVLATQAQENIWLPWLWPNVFWDDPSKESPRWTDTELEFKRSEIWAEASIKAIGMKSGFIGGYFDIILPDDIACLQASQDPPLMERARKFIRASMTRFYDKKRGIHIGVGTHWSPNDVYVDPWKKITKVETMIYSIVEWDDEKKIEVPLWPEKYPLDVIDDMRKGTDPIEWAHWFMNKPAPDGYTALNWSDLREYHMSEDGREIYFEDSKMDERIAQRYQTISRNLGFVLGSAKYDPMNAKLRSGKSVKGMDDDFLQHMRVKYERCERCGVKLAGPGEQPACEHAVAQAPPTGYQFLGQVQ